MATQKTIGMISLGCPKNQVDAELMLDKLARAGFAISGDIEGCDAVIVNTCGFIEAAKVEAIENILDMAEYKKSGDIQKLIVTGCLSERYQYDIRKEMPEVDAVVGIGENANIVQIVDEVLGGDLVEAFADKELLPLTGGRILTTPDYWAYLKIGDGCSNNCAFCAIPEIRGKFRSRTIEDIVDEAKTLASQGVREVVLISQDTSLYGRDLYKENKLPELLTAISEVGGIEWIRFLYCYPERIGDELLDVMATNPKVCHYLDIPLQHADKSVLRGMHRPGDRETFENLIKKIREKVPDMVIRTTVMTGFPGETDEQFEELAEFVKAMKFDNLGCFAFSPEEGTVAAEREDQIDEEVKVHRQDLIMQLQHDIVLENNKKFLGKTLKVLVDGYNSYDDTYVGRFYGQVPDIDGTVLFTSPRELTPGEFVDVTVLGFDEYDLTGKAL
ncbi:MAG: 30S ribosomal protein S12 methylthiotransferase RimO [Clostridia bacterium]|nr:30S ribosomal protein S12 methylthiotransferase RimO [Clostridia bacterium]